MGTILLTGAAGEAARLARALAEAGLDVAHRPVRPDARPPGCGPAEALGEDRRARLRRRATERLLDETGARAVIGAEHPFASEDAGDVQRAARERGLPFVRLMRPPWRPGPHDDWRRVPSGAEVPAAVPPGAVVFLATGRHGTRHMAAHDGPIHCRLRAREAPPYPEANGRWALGEGPFTVDGETALFEALGIECLVTRNVGGTGAWPKVEAARRLRLPVVMISRPRHVGPTVETPDEAVAWASAL